MSRWKDRENWPGGEEQRDVRPIPAGSTELPPRRRYWPDNFLETENPSSGVQVESPVQDPLDQLGIDSDGNLILPGFPPQLSAPGTVTTHENTPYTPFTAVLKLYTQESQLLLLFVDNSQYSNVVFLRDLMCPIHFHMVDCFGIEFGFCATFREVIPPRLGFSYPYPFDVVLHIEGEIKVLNVPEFRKRYPFPQQARRRFPTGPHHTWYPQRPR